MKYIRTKETEYGCIIDTEKYLKETGEECYIPENEIIKQADTIEELINRYVVRKTMYKIYTKLQFEKLSMNKVKDMLSKGYEIFGAIWTDKGLIYVAKMNEKGELCLL